MQARHSVEQIRREKCWSGEDYPLATILGLSGKNTEQIAFAPDAMHHLLQAHELSHSRKELPRDPAVSFRPSKRTFFFRLARSEIVNTGPCGRVLRQRAVIVATGIVHVPKQGLGIEPVLAKPFSEGNLVKGGVFLQQAVSAFQWNGKAAARMKRMNQI